MYTHMDIHPLPAPPFLSCAFRRLLGFHSGFLGCSWVSFPYPSQGLSIHFPFLHLPFSLALLALLFLCFFLLFLRLFRYLFRLSTRAPPSGAVCVSPRVPTGSVPLFPLQPLNEAGGRSVFRWLRPTKLVWTRDTRIGHPGVPALTELLLKLFHFLFASMVLHATPHKQVSHRSFQPLVNCSQPREWNIFSTIQVTGLFRLAVPPPSFSTWELSSLNTNVRVCARARAPRKQSELKNMSVIRASNQGILGSLIEQERN